MRPSLSRRLTGHGLTGALARISIVERAMLAAVVALAVTLGAFAKIASEVADGGVAFDRDILLAFRDPADLADPLGPSWFEEVMRDLTALGGNAVLTLVTAIVIGFLLFRGRRHAALLVLASVAGGLLLATVAKYGFSRPRPDIVPHVAQVYTPSFPSSHAAMSAIVYLTLGALGARTQPGVATKVYALSVAVLLTLLVGTSRVYLGVHWPTDVLAGWALGAAWALLCWLAALWLQSRGKVEPDEDDLDEAKGG